MTVGQRGHYRGCVHTLLVALLIAVTQPLLADDRVSLADIDTITILPIVFPTDPERVERGEALQGLYGPLDEYIYKALLRKLALKGYVLDRPRDWTTPPDWNVETLRALPLDELARLLPTSATYAALLLVERVQADASLVVATSAEAAVSAMIVHRASATAVWQRRSDGEFAETVLPFGPVVMFITPDKHAAVEDAFGRLFDDLPERVW